MSKKAKRKVSQVSPSAASSVKQPVASQPEAESPARSTFTRRSQSTTEFNPDYTYIVNDLKRIGTLAGAFFVLLIVLTFFIR